MKHRISRLLILCLLLCGCSQPKAVTPVVSPVSNAGLPPQGLYDMGSSLEIASSGTVKVFPLGNRTGTGLLSFDDSLLLISGEATSTITLLTGDTLVPTAEKRLAFLLNPADCTQGQNPATLSYFDPNTRQTILLDQDLQELQRIDAPENMTGRPRLSEDSQTLYYCTAHAVLAWDLASGIHRVLKQTVPGANTVEDVLFSGRVLHCRTQEGISLFLSTETGELLYESTAKMKLAAPGDQYIAAVWERNLWSLVFGAQDTQQALTPANLSSEYYLLAEENAVVTGSVSGTVLTMDYYDLTSGRRLASQMFQGGFPLSLIYQNSGIYLLLSLEDYGAPVICRWDLSAAPSGDPHVYTGPCFTPASPDLQGLSQCQADADRIGQPYGLHILTGPAVEDGIPKKYTPVSEYRVNILNRELELLDSRLARFPEAVLRTTAGNFRSLTICLVSQIQNDPGNRGSAQYFDGSDAYILLAVGDTSEQGLYHELFHVMETHILSHSSAFDQWSSLNPPGFQYDYNYQTNAIRNSGIYLTDKNRSFIDTFSMSFPKEDRARILEYAMLPDQGHLFQTSAMQGKLRAVCLGIRDAYGLPEGETYPWEQYLKQPLVTPAS